MAVVALEVRSSSFLIEKYVTFMDKKQNEAKDNCQEICKKILTGNLGTLLKQKNKEIYKLIEQATEDTFKELDFRQPSWSLTKELIELTALLKKLKENIKTLHKRDYLSITPKMEDIALVNRWIQKYNVKHFYVQVFFDKAYIISFQNILELVANDENEGTYFSIERDIKNQRKTTIKINVNVGKAIIGQIDKLFVYFLSDMGQEIIKSNKRSYGNNLDKFEPEDLNKSLCPNQFQFSLLENREIEAIIKIAETNESVAIQMSNDLIKN
jgi:hypothetical protein